MAQASPASSILGAVGQSFLDAASTIDANIDASALVDRLNAADSDPSGQRTRKALGELKDLVRRAPAAVVAAQGALPAIFRIITRLAQTCGQEGEDDAAEALQDALEALGLLLGEAGAPRAGAKSSDAKLDQAASQRAAEVAELALRYTENGRQLLRVLSARDVSTQYDAMVVLQRIYHRLPEPINAALLADPMALNRLMQVLQSCQVDYVRNESLSLLLLLTASNADIQQIVTMQGLADTVFALLEEEDLRAGGKVARDLVRCLHNLVGSTTCQRCIRETGGAAALVAAMRSAVARPRPAAGDDEEEDSDFDAPGRLDVPEEARWACFLLLADVALTFAGAAGGTRSGLAAVPSESTHEVPANREALIRNGALDLLEHLTDARPSLEAKLRLVRLLEILEMSPLSARRMEHADRGRGALLSDLGALLLGHGAPLELKSALSRVLCRTIARHPSLQLFLLASLSPQIEPAQLGEAVPVGRLIVGLLEKAIEGRFEPEQLWFALHLLLAMITDNASVQGALPSMRIAFPGGDVTAEFCLDLLFMAFSCCARKCLESMPVEEDSPDRRAPPEGPSAPPAALLASLKLLAYWLTACPPAVVAFASSPVMVPRAMDLTTIGDLCGQFFKVQIEGLACLVMGMCIKTELKEVHVAPLMALVANRVGIEGFQQKVERLFRSEALQRPPRGLASFRWHNGRFRHFVRDQQQAIQRRMVQLYVAEGIGAGGAALSEDVADQYKQLIRVQDERFREVQKENEQLRSEVEAFMRRSLQASSVALVEKMDALQMENEALHKEVAQLEQDNAQQVARLERDLGRCRGYICELEQQRESMAVGYEQVERGAEALRREVAELRAALAAAERTRQGPSDAAAVAREAEEAKRAAEELRTDRADLLELLGRLVAACPDASKFVAPLGQLQGATLLIAGGGGGG